MRTYKQGDNSNDVIFYMVDNTDHVTPKTGLTLTVKVKKNGAGFLAGTGTTTELEDGLYKYVPALSEMGTLGPIHFKATSAGADNCVIEGVVVAYDPYSTYFGISKINSLKDSWNDPTAAECKADLTTLEGRLTAARAAFLDKLDIDGDLSTFNVASDDVNISATSVGSIVSAVWGYANRTLTSFGDLVANTVSGVWTSVTRTLTAGTKDSEIEAIKAKTDSLNFIGTDVKSVASNMRGTDNALLAANYTSPDNTGIAAAQTAAESADGKLPADTTAKLANLDATISSRLADADYTSPPSEASIASAVWNYATSLMITAGSIGLKFKEWVVGKITSIDDTVDFTSVQKTSLNAATPSVTINDKTGFSLTSEYDPAKTAAQVSDTETIQTVVEFIKDVNEGDCFIDQTTTPFQMVVHKKGDPTTEFIRKDLLDQNGDGITDLTTHTIYQREPS